MKVEGTKGAGATTKSKKSSSSSDADFSQYVKSGTTETQGVATSQSIAQLDVLLSVQASENPTERAAKKRVRVRADNILGKLETIRIAMLGGGLTVGHMIDVADVVASHRDKIHDPVLTAIMDEIDLRAQVELAKMRVVLDSGLNSMS